MRAVPFVQLDVFTRKPFTGNPLAVFPDASGLDSGLMQKIAREMNLSETTFVLPPTKPKADYRVRIFTPAQELPYAGHPSVGTGWHLAANGRLKPKAPTTRFHQEVPAGVLPIDFDVDSKGRPAKVFTTQARPKFGKALKARRRVANALGLDESDLSQKLPIQLVSTGLPWLIVPLRGSEALDRARPKLSEFAGPNALPENIYPFTLEGAPAGADTESRGFPTREFEDPVTGSASGCLGAYLVQNGLVPARKGLARLVNAQGRHLDRPGRATVEVTVDAKGAPLVVRVGGPAVEVLRGEVQIG